jgi:hypothetical protein
MSTGFWKSVRRRGRAEMFQGKYSKNSEIWNGRRNPSTLIVARSAADSAESGAKVEIYFEVAARGLKFFLSGLQKRCFSPAKSAEYGSLFTKRKFCCLIPRNCRYDVPARRSRRPSE